MHFAKTYGFKASLHSMYVVWFQGGIAMVLFVTVVGWRFVAAGWKSPETAVAKAILIGLAATLLAGAFHQMHQTPRSGCFSDWEPPSLCAVFRSATRCHRRRAVAIAGVVSG